MVEYQVLSWRKIPSMVVVRGDGREVQGRLPQRYQDAIDEAAMGEDVTEGDAYLEGWNWGPVELRNGSPEEVLAAVIEELARRHPLEGSVDAFNDS